MHYFSYGSQKKELLILQTEMITFLRGDAFSEEGNGFIHVIEKNFRLVLLN